MKNCFVFCHGWGFSSEFWQNLRPFFAQDRCEFLDLGYFTHSRLKISQESEYRYIGVGHSLGLIKLLNLEIDFSAIIGLQSFLNFIGKSASLAEKRRAELELMIKHFSQNPKKCLQSFHRSCGVTRSDFDLGNNLNMDILAADLHALSMPVVLKNKVPLLILAAMDDLVVPPDLLQDNFADYSNVQLVIQEHGQHVLGFKYPELVSNQIKLFIGES